MEFKTLFPIMKKHLADGDDVPYFFRELMAMLTTVTEDEWGTGKDPSVKLSDETIRSYTKRKLPKKLASSIVYRLTPEVMVERINEHSDASRRLLADDLKGYDATLNADNVADAISGWMVEIVQESAGLVPQDALQKQQQQQLASDLKIRYGDYLLSETDGYCPFPGCGKQLTITNKGKAVHTYEVSLIDKGKPAVPDNLIAMCPQCYATYLLDDSKKLSRELKEIKNILSTHKQSVHLLDDLPLEKGIVGVIRKVKKLGEKELVGTSFDPKEIKQKLSPSQDMALYIAVNSYVTTYYPQIKEIMMNLDKRGEIDYDEIQDQIHAFYKRLKKQTSHVWRPSTRLLARYTASPCKMNCTARLLSPISCKAVRYSMQLPNKLYSYKASTLALIPKVLTELKNGPVEVKDLFLVMRPSLSDATDFLSVMDCLYALRAVDINEEGEVFSCL